MKAIKDEKGLTLIEVLAALVILSIAFIGIMTIFPQMTLFNQITAAKLDTMNLARQEIAKVVSPAQSGAAEEFTWIGKRSDADPTVYETFTMKIPLVMANLPAAAGTSAYTIDSAGSTSDFMRFQKTGDYDFEVDIYTQCEPFQASASGSSMACNDPRLPQLYKVHLKVFQQGRLSSETFSYIKYSVEKQGV